MALSNAEKQRAYRRRKAEERLRYQNVTVVDELQQLRDEVTLLKALLRARAVKTLPSDSESTSLEKKERESEQARLARLEAWTPNDACRKRAYDEAHDNAWLNRQAEMYRCQQANAKLKHKDFDRGFLKWILNAPAFEDRPIEPKNRLNGHGLANGSFKPSPMNNFAKGMADALREREENRRAGSEPAVPLLDSGGRSGSS